jgi:hypothetical protein
MVGKTGRKLFGLVLYKLLPGKRNTGGRAGENTVNEPRRAALQEIVSFVGLITLKGLSFACGGEEPGVEEDAGRDVVEDRADGVEGDVEAAEDAVGPSCDPIPVELSPENVNVYGFISGGRGDLIWEEGYYVLHFTASGVRDPGVVIQPEGMEGWRLDCPTGTISRLSFEIKGTITTSRLDLQIYFEGDSETIPSVPGQWVSVTPDWSTGSVEIPSSLIASGRTLVVKLQPIGIGTGDVDVRFRNLRFE